MVPRDTASRQRSAIWIRPGGAPEHRNPVRLGAVVLHGADRTGIHDDDVSPGLPTTCHHDARRGARMRNRSPMQASRRSRFVALAAAVFVVALVSAGCARRGQSADAAGAAGAATSSPVATVPVLAATPAPSAEPSAAPTAATTPVPPSAGTPVPPPAATPVPSPDLSSVDSLIKDITNDLDADASAGADEGSTP
jgi:hypothetical protein